MKQAPYMASTELKQLMWLSANVQMLESILQDPTTKDKDWRKWLKTAASYTSKVINARVEALDGSEVMIPLRPYQQELMAAVAALAVSITAFYFITNA